MKTKITASLLLLLASCTSLDIDGVRMSAGLQPMKVAARTEINGQTDTDHAEDTAPVARVELVNDLDPQTQVGMVLGASRGTLGIVDFESYDLGAAVRHYIGEGQLRPFGEFTAGYRRFEVDDEDFGSAGTDLIFGSASVGLELRLGRMSIFAQGGYEGAYGDDFHTSGPTIMVGGAVTF